MDGSRVRLSQLSKELSSQLAGENFNMTDVLKNMARIQYQLGEWVEDQASLDRVEAE